MASTGDICDDEELLAQQQMFGGVTLDDTDHHNAASQPGLLFKSTVHAEQEDKGNLLSLEATHDSLQQLYSPAPLQTEDIEPVHPESLLSVDDFSRIRLSQQYLNTEAPTAALLPDYQEELEDKCRILSHRRIYFREIFSEVNATLNDELAELIPISDMQSIRDLWTMDFDETGKQSYCVRAAIEDIVAIRSVLARQYESLIANDTKQSVAVQTDNTSSTATRHSPYNHRIHYSNTEDKGVTCDLLKPMFSRSGRRVAKKTNDDYLDSSAVESLVVTARSKPKMIRTGHAKSASQKSKGSTKEKDDVNVQVKTEPEEDRCLITLKDTNPNDAGVDFSNKPKPTLIPATELDGIMLGGKKHKKDYEACTPYKFFCSRCSYKSKRRKHLLKHEEHHRNNAKLYHCSKCDFTAIRQSTLNLHKVEHSSKIYRCNECKYISDDVKCIQRHKKQKHSARVKDAQTVTKKKVYECSHCTYKTLYLMHYQRHLKCHTPLDLLSSSLHSTVIDGEVKKDLVSSYECDQCGYQTALKGTLMRHHRTVHGTNRPHLCDTCGMSFKRKDSLKAHRVTHIKREKREYQWHCTECNKSFRTQAHLRAHASVHTTEREYLCEQCGMSFKTRAVQRKHIDSIHKNPRAHRCHLCSKRFNLKYSLQRHLLKHESTDEVDEKIALMAAGGSSATSGSVDKMHSLHILPSSLELALPADGNITMKQSNITEAIFLPTPPNHNVNNADRLLHDGESSGVDTSTIVTVTPNLASKHQSALDYQHVSTDAPTAYIDTQQHVSFTSNKHQHQAASTEQVTHGAHSVTQHHTHGSKMRLTDTSPQQHIELKHDNYLVNVGHIDIAQNIVGLSQLENSGGCNAAGDEKEQTILLQAEAKQDQGDVSAVTIEVSEEQGAQHIQQSHTQELQAQQLYRVVAPYINEDGAGETATTTILTLEELQAALDGSSKSLRLLYTKPDDVTT